MNLNVMKILMILLVMGFTNGSEGKESSCNTGDTGSIPGSGTCPGEGNGNPLHYSCLGSLMEGYSPKYSKQSDTIEPLSTITQGMGTITQET